MLISTECQKPTNREGLGSEGLGAEASLADAMETRAAYFGERCLRVIGMLDGDTDADWDVDSVDLANLAGVFGGDGDWHTDFNGDGRVDLTDFALMCGNFGAGVGSSPGADPVTTTPEPASAVLLLLGLGATLWRRRR
jgi:hypothetical protein